MKWTIVITGASDGIGTAAARRLAAAGNEVVVVGRSASKARTVADDLGAEYLCADFSHLEQVRSLADELRKRYPRIDVLANNAPSATSPHDPSRTIVAGQEFCRRLAVWSRVRAPGSDRPGVRTTLAHSWHNGGSEMGPS